MVTHEQITGATFKPSTFLDDLAAEVILRIRSLPDEDLTKLQASCARITTRNCPYYRYDINQAVLPLVREEVRERPIRRRQQVI